MPQGGRTAARCGRMLARAGPTNETNKVVPAFLIHWPITSCSWNRLASNRRNDEGERMRSLASKPLPAAGSVKGAS